MKIAFDLDGTLYNTAEALFSVDAELREEFGYPTIRLQDYVANYQSKDWRQFYIDLGVRDSDVDMFIDGFVKAIKQKEPPLLIEGAKEILYSAEKAFGYEGIRIITNESLEGVENRFIRDDLTEFLDRVDTPFVGKSQEIYDFASTDADGTVFYVGDIVSDGEECAAARQMGANNLQFLGLLHSYALNPAQKIQGFVDSNPDFAKALNNLSDVERLWKEK